MKQIKEMAKVDVVYDRHRAAYIIAIWGNLSNDRTTPHIHIWRADDSKSNYNNFNLELSLTDLLVKDKWVLLRKKDTVRHIDETGHTEDWTPYTSLLRGLQKRFADEEKDLLGEIIHTWNKERDIEKTLNGGNPLKEWLDERGLQVLPKYQKYFGQPRQIINEMAKLNIKDGGMSCFPPNAYRVIVQGDNSYKKPPHIHISSVQEGFNIRVYIENGELMSVESYGKRKRSDNFSDILKKVKLWFSQPSTLFKEYTNKEVASILWTANNKD